MISQQAFAEDAVVRFGVTRGKSVPAAVGLELHRFEKNESDIDVQVSVIGRALDVAGEPDLPGHPQNGSNSAKVICSAKVTALAGSAAHRDVHQGYDYLW